MAEHGKPGGWHDADDPLANKRTLVAVTSSPKEGGRKGPGSKDDAHAAADDEESTEEASEPVEAFADDGLTFQADPAPEPPAE